MLRRDAWSRYPLLWLITGHQIESRCNHINYKNHLNHKNQKPYHYYRVYFSLFQRQEVEKQRFKRNLSRIKIKFQFLPVLIKLCNLYLICFVCQNNTYLNRLLLYDLLLKCKNFV